jgi:hypothetical protein
MHFPACSMVMVPDDGGPQFLPACHAIVSCVNVFGVVKFPRRTSVSSERNQDDSASNQGICDAEWSWRSHVYAFKPYSRGFTYRQSPRNQSGEHRSGIDDRAVPRIRASETA